MPQQQQQILGQILNIIIDSGWLAFKRLLIEHIVHITIHKSLKVHCEQFWFQKRQPFT